MAEILTTIFAVLISGVVTGIIITLIWNIGTYITNKIERKK